MFHISALWLVSHFNVGREPTNKMSSSNGKPHFDGFNEYRRDGKPCRACTDFKTWAKMTRKESKHKEVFLNDQLRYI